MRSLASRMWLLLTPVYAIIRYCETSRRIYRHVIDSYVLPLDEESSLRIRSAWVVGTDIRIYLILVSNNLALLAEMDAYTACGHN